MKKKNLSNPLDVYPGRVYNLSEAAKYLRLGKNKVKGFINLETGGLNALVINSGARITYRILGEDLMRFIGNPTIKARRCKNK